VQGLTTGAYQARSGLDPTFAGPTGLWSKALRDTAKHLDITSLKAQKLHPTVIWLQVQTMCGRLAVRNAESQMDLLKQFKIDYAQGIATVTADGVSVRSVSADGTYGGATKSIKSAHVLIATGSKATRMNGIPFDDVRIFESDSIAKLAFLPNSVVVQGSGIVAIEYAMIFSHLGARVTMLVRGDVMSSLTRVGIDHDIAVHLVESCHAQGITIMEGSTPESFAIDDSTGVTISTKNKDGSTPVVQVARLALSLLSPPPSAKPPATLRSLLVFPLCCHLFIGGYISRLHRPYPHQLQSWS
jgi:pyruvate/2-oxoglutarate dehydrogenase complex dihydrolipoamide dehydrogenase (E3) component